MTNYLGMLGQAGSAWYGEKKFDEAREDIKEGFGTARESIKEYEQPYADFGLRQMQEFEDQGQFQFGAEEFEASPGYQFRQEEGAKQVSRQQAAQKMLGSGGTLAALQERGQNIAKDEFQAAYDRAKGTYETNLSRNKFGVELGQKVAMNIGDNLADLGIGEGMAMAQLNGMQAKRMSETISSTLAAAGNPADPDTVSGWINEAIQSGVDNVGGFIKDKLLGLGGSLATKAAGALGFGGAASGTGAATGFTGTAVHAGFTGTAGTAVEAAAASSGVSSGAASAFMAGAGGAALTILGPLAIGLAMTWGKDRRGYTDRAEDELAKSGNPVLAATGIYQNALMKGDVRETANARGVMLDTINNPKNTTSVNNPYYASFALEAMNDAMRGLSAVGSESGSGHDTDGTDHIGRALGLGGTYGAGYKTKNFANDAGKALRAVFGYDPLADKAKDQLEKLYNMKHSRNTKYDGLNYSEEKRKLTQMMNQLIASKPQWNLGSMGQIMEQQQKNAARVAAFRKSGMSPQAFQKMLGEAGSIAAMGNV